MYPSTIISWFLAYHFLITTTVFPVFILKNSNFYSLSFPMWTTINCFTNLLLFLTLLSIYFPLYQVNICGQITKIVPLYVLPITLPSLPSLYSTLYLPGKTLIPNNYIIFFLMISKLCTGLSISVKPGYWPLCFPFTPSDLVLLILFTHYVFSITVVIQHIH